MKTEKQTLVAGASGLLILLITVIAGIIILKDKAEIGQLTQHNLNLNTTLEIRDSLVNEMANTFDEIEQNLSFVRDKRDEMISIPGEGVKSQQEILVADVKLMNEMLAESSKKMEEMDKKLKASGIEIKSFKNKIAQLNKLILEQENSMAQLHEELEQRDNQLEEKEMRIAQLKNDISSKEDSIQTKSQIITEKSQTINEKVNQINKAWFVAGTHSELIENGVIEKEGGFLGIAKNNTINDDLNEKYFTSLDIRNTNQFTLNTRKAKLISKHPENSYRLVEKNDMIAYLEIENPEEFWKITKYAIVETK
jgi:DNA repair exonuclease SbcCD ATPase subunit